MCPKMLAHRLFNQCQGYRSMSIQVREARETDIGEIFAIRTSVAENHLRSSSSPRWASHRRPLPPCSTRALVCGLRRLMASPWVFQWFAMRPGAYLDCSFATTMKGEVWAAYSSKEPSAIYSPNSMGFGWKLRSAVESIHSTSVPAGFPLRNGTAAFNEVRQRPSRGE